VAGLGNHRRERGGREFRRLWHGWKCPEESGLCTDPRLDRDYEPIWTTAEGGVTYVRRDAVPDAERLADARLVSQQVMDAVMTSLNHEGPTSWTCGAAVRPSPFGAAAATAARGG